MKVLMLVMSNVDRDSRVQREAVALAGAGHDVTIAALAGHSTPAYRVVTTTASGVPVRRGTQVPLRRLARWALLPLYLHRIQQAFVVAARRAVADLPADAVHAHNFSTLPLGRELADKRGAGLVYDAHECWVGRRKDGRDTPLRDLVDLRAERRLACSADAVLTVSPMLRCWYQRRTGRSVHLVRNTFPPPDCDVANGPAGERAASKRPQALLFAGNTGPGRDLNTLARADLPIAKWIVGDDHGRNLPGVVIHPPVPVDHVDGWYRSAGLALIALTDDCLNHRVALPNKLFHAVRAGVPVVAADLPQLRQQVLNTGIGTLYRPGDPHSLQRAAYAALASYDDHLTAVRRAWRTDNWTADRMVLESVYDSLERE